MKIGIVGLGLIGGSMALALSRAGHEVYGTSRRGVPEAAYSSGAVKGELTDRDAPDVVFLAVPPAATLGILQKGGFRAGQIVADICGVKACLREAGEACGGVYVGCHPMAGREVGGFVSARADLFKGASFILTDTEGKEAAAETLERLARDMGFGRTVRCSSERHDRTIAYTSQLAHVVSSAYIKSPAAGDHLGFTGGSFQDMTRIAAMDEEMWTELFFYNRENLIGEVRSLSERLGEYAEALESGDRERMRALLRDGSARKRAVASDVR